MLDAELTSIEVLGLAVTQEIEANKRYQLMAARVNNPLAKEKFRSLAREERAHRELLYKLLQKYTGEVKPPLPKKAPRKYRESDLNASLPDLILQAIEKEREAQAFYRKAAASSADPTGKRLMLYLALFEEGHERSLQIEYDAISKYPQWFESDGADILLVGP